MARYGLRAGPGGAGLGGAIHAAALLAAMLAAAAGLWLGVPLAWLYVASLVQGETGSVGAALLCAFAGVAVSIPLAALLLGALSARYRALSLARGRRDPGAAPLEAVMVSSAAVAVIGVAIWFVGFSGSAPLPVPSGT